jgi:hypothetical protein
LVVRVDLEGTLFTAAHLCFEIKSWYHLLNNEAVGEWSLLAFSG